MELSSFRQDIVTVDDVATSQSVTQGDRIEETTWARTHPDNVYCNHWNNKPVAGNVVEMASKQ